MLADGGTDADAAGVPRRSSSATSRRCPDSGRDATTAFTSGTGDVLLSYENEAILARQSGTDFDYVVPDSTLLIQNPCAVTKDAPTAAAGLHGLPEERRRARSSTPRPATARSSTCGGVDGEGRQRPEQPVPGARARC